MKHCSLQHLMVACRAMVVGAMLAVVTTLSFAPSDADAAVTIPVDVPKFTGTFTITSFTTQTVNGVEQLAAVGTLTGSEKKGPKGALNQVVIGNITVPATLTGSTCDILHLDLGPLHLDVLGLNVDLSEVILDITAVGGAGNLLGNLLCAVAGLLDPAGPLTQIVGLLNQILDLLG